MREKFKDVNFRSASLRLITLCQRIIADYLAQDFRLTLRQLYYQLVIRNAIPNQERQYKMLSRLLSDARLAGLIDWAAIEDRVRQPRHQSEFRNLEELVDAAIHSYRLPRWEGQRYYVELWVEKDALAGVLEPLASEFHVTMMVNRGYSSQSAMYDAANRFNRAGGEGVLLYLGDHDPSGEDMVRDIQERLDLFGAEVDVRKLALTMEQIEEHEPPPNPAKMSDARAEAYVRQHGASSWEVDALPPNVLGDVIREAFSDLIAPDELNAILRQEETDKRQLQEAVRSIRGSDNRGGRRPRR